MNELLDKYAADERFLSHEELHQIANLAVKLDAENKRLRDALEDYAEPQNWTWDGHAGHDVCVWDPMGDGYKRAKEALEGLWYEE